MSRFNELLGKARSFLGRPKTETRATDAVRHDRFDNVIFDELMAEAPALADLATELGDHFDYAEDLLRDTLMQFWQGEPKVRAAAEMDTRYLANHAVATDLAAAPETTQARSYTRYDKYGAAMAAIGAGEKVRSSLERFRDLDTQTKAAEQAEEAAEAAEAALDEAVAAAEQAGMPPIGPPSPAQTDAADALVAALSAAEQAAEDVTEATEAIQQAAARARAAMREPLREAVTETIEKLEDEANLFRAWGVGDGDLQQMDFETRRQLALRLRNSRLAKFQKLIGRFKLMRAAQRVKKIEYGRDEVVGTELSGDLSRVVPVEFAYYANKHLRRDFLVRLVEDRLLSRKYQGSEHVGMGAIICLVDTSQSMDGDREAWAKAFALALLDQARESRRDFVAISFSSRSQQAVWHFPKGAADLADVIAFTEHFFGGGTNFDQPLDKAIAILEREFNEAGKAKADLVFITDDECRVSTEWMASYLARKDRLAFRTFGVAVGMQRAGSTLAALSDNVRAITDFTDPAEVADIIQVIH